MRDSCLVAVKAGCLCIIEEDFAGGIQPPLDTACRLADETHIVRRQGMLGCGKILDDLLGCSESYEDDGIGGSLKAVTEHDGDQICWARGRNAQLRPARWCIDRPVDGRGVSA